MANKSLAHQRDFYLIWLLFYLSVVSVPNLVLNTVIVMGKKNEILRGRPHKEKLPPTSAN